LTAFNWILLFRNYIETIENIRDWKIDENILSSLETENSEIVGKKFIQEELNNYFKLICLHVKKGQFNTEIIVLLEELNPFLEKKDHFFEDSRELTIEFLKRELLLY